MENIFFVVSFLLLFTGVLLMYKVPEKVSLLRCMVLCFISYLCWEGAIIVGIYSLASIRIGLPSLGAANFLMAIPIWGQIIYQHKVQKFTVLQEDVYSFLAIIIWFVAIFFKVFSPSINNSYTNSDPAVHFRLALDVLDTGRVSSMYFAEVYNSVVIRLLEPFLSKVNLYKAFILADSTANLLNVLMFYCLAATLIKSKTLKRIFPFFAFLYFVGWPFFNYAIGGFVYFGWGVTLIAYVVYLLMLFERCREKSQQVVLLGLIMVGCYAILVCYMLFAPVIAAIVIGCAIVFLKKQKKITFPQVIIIAIAMVSLIIAGVYNIFFSGYFNGSIVSFFEALKTDGGIAKDPYQDFVFLLPGLLYIGWKHIKTKDFNVLFITCSVVILYILCTFMCVLLGIMSPYYYYKSYYLLWLFAWISNIEFMELWLHRDKAILFSYWGTVALVAFITLSGAGNEMAKKKIAVDEVSQRLYPSPVPIWDRTKIFLLEKDAEKYTDDSSALQDIYQYINEEFPEQTDIPFISDVYWLGKWYYGYTGMRDMYISSEEELEEVVQQCRNEGCQYIVIYQNMEIYRQCQEWLADFENIYDNWYYGIYRIG